VPEHPAISIKAGIAPQVAGGLSALVEKVLADVAAQQRAKGDRGARKSIVNKYEGTVRGTLFQIGNVEGDVHQHGDR
jgi:hypothetical protein